MTWPLTLKAHKKKKTHIVVPNQPFYHNDEYLDDDESEQQIEMQSYNYDNDILAIDPQIFSLENFTSKDDWWSAWYFQKNYRMRIWE